MPVRAVLVGLPGTGKSTVGAELAARWQVPFADSDDLVEASAGRSITEIFAEDGEPGFRRLEAEAIQRALSEFDGVLALGGGAVTTPAVRSALSVAGVPVVLLTAEPAELLRRMAGTDHRPLLAGDPAARLATLAADRDALYRAVCTHRCDTGGRTASELAAELAAQLTSSERPVE